MFAAFSSQGSVPETAETVKAPLSTTDDRPVPNNLGGRTSISDLLPLATTRCLLLYVLEPTATSCMAPAAWIEAARRHRVVSWRFVIVVVVVVSVALIPSRVLCLAVRIPRPFHGGPWMFTLVPPMALRPTGRRLTPN